MWKLIGLLIGVIAGVPLGYWILLSYVGDDEWHVGQMVSLIIGMPVGAVAFGILGVIVGAIVDLILKRAKGDDKKKP